MKNAIVSVVAVALIASAASAATVTYGWEDGGTILGQYSDIIATNVTSPVHSGSHSLQLEDDATSGTPQAFVGWVNGLTDGDVVTASFWAYDTTPGAAPSGRIWGHYTDDNTDIDSYAGSAGGNYDYPAGDGWSLLSYTWTFDSSGGTRDGLIIEARTYSNDGDTIWVDDLTITAPETATITVVPEPASLSLLAVAGLGLLRRRNG